MFVCVKYVIALIKGGEGGLPLQRNSATSRPSPADIESKFDQRIRETEERLQQQFGSLVERVNKSNRDATRARFDELKARVDELYHAQAAGLDELVAAGKLDATDAAVQKLQWRDKYERQVLAEARKVTQPEPLQSTQDAAITQSIASQAGSSRSRSGNRASVTSCRRST